jgi:predicted transport protein
MATPEEMTASMIANLKEKTGRDLAAWLKLIGRAKLAKHGEIVTWLKGEHALTHGYANLVAHKALASDAGSAGTDTDLVADQYAGKKAGLRPIYDALAHAIRGFGEDVELAPKKAYVSLRRAKQFGLIQPSTATRVDVGLNLKGEPPTKRLEPSGSFNAMVSHRVRVESLADVDQQLVGWLKQAYERT